jgi:Fuc2NAc and GlcNAc transferase
MTGIAIGVVAVLVVSVALTGLARLYAMHNGLVDQPNSRSSHSWPTLRGGGIGFVITFEVTVVLLAVVGLVPLATSVALLGGGAAVAAIGFLDDHQHVPARFRFVVHVLAAIWVVAWLDPTVEDAIGGTDLPAWVAALATVMFIVWLLNLYNFMDGIDGLAGVEAVTAGLGGAVVAFWLLPESGVWVLPLLLAAAVGGFLAWNVPPARIFMGDVGSGFLGVCFAVLALESLAATPRLFWAWMILLGVFIVDATFTLVRRTMRGRPFYEAHRSHAYQHAASRFGHLPVMLAAGICNLLWLLPFAWLVATGRLAPFWGIGIAYLPLLGALIYFGGGTDRESARVA